MEILNAIYQWTIGVEGRGLLFTLRWIFLVLDVILLALFIYVFTRALEYRPDFIFAPKPRKRPSSLRDPKFLGRWETILKKADSKPPESLTLAIVEADSFVDDVLKKMNLAGEHMADRLERLDRRDLKSIDRLWKAHRIRNDLVHTPGFTVPAADAKGILGDYEAFLKEIGLLK
ncbi:MAG: hypothetical protein HY378_00965 [Candidatus Brennerbacteria bacterium]|nr:hypothetical protein [Candidatus Brennerbacteria bacterium]